MRQPKPTVAIFLTVLIDMLSFGMAIPDIQLRGERLGATGWLLGLLLASFSLAQLLTAPYLGQLSDRIGRRKVLLVTCSMTLACFLIYANATTLALMFAARVLAGISGANIGVAFAYIADVTSPQERAKGMGLVGAAFGLGFILGPPMGALLVKWGGGSPALLGYTAATLALINLYFIWRFLPEPARELRPVSGNPYARTWQGVGAALRSPGLGIVILLFFGSTYSFSNLESTFFRLMEQRFLLTQAEGALVLAWVGVVAAIVQGGLIRSLSQRFGEPNLMRIGYWLQVPVLALVPFSPPWLPLLAISLLLGLATGVASPSTSSMISRLAPAALVGSIFGVTQAVGALGRVLGPMTGSIAFEVSPAFPYFIASAVMLVPAVCSLFVRLPKHEQGHAAQAVP